MTLEVEDFLKKNVSVIVNYNEFKTQYFDTVSDYLKEMGNNFFYQWVDGKEKKNAIQENTIWTIMYYPNHAANGFGFAASSLEALINHIKKIEQK